MVKPDAVTRREAKESFACSSGDWGTVTQGVVVEHVEIYLFFTLRIIRYCQDNLRYQNYSTEQYQA